MFEPTGSHRTLDDTASGGRLNQTAPSLAQIDPLQQGIQRGAQVTRQTVQGLMDDCESSEHPSERHQHGDSIDTSIAVWSSDGYTW